MAGTLSGDTDKLIAAIFAATAVGKLNDQKPADYIAAYDNFRHHIGEYEEALMDGQAKAFIEMMKKL